MSRYATDSQSLIRSRWEEEKRIAELEKQAAARELLGGGEYLHTCPVLNMTMLTPFQDSVFRTSGASSGTATPFPGSQQAIQSNPMSAPPPKQISASTSLQYEVEEVEDDLVTAPR